MPSENASSTRLGMRLAWARETLGVTEGSLAEVRQRMLRIVTDEDFVPPESIVQAFRTLEADAAGVAEVDDPPAFAIDSERQLRREVETFAARMFSLSVSERRAKWERLYARSEHSQRARTRLDQLRAAVAADVSVLNTRPERTQRLARYLCELSAQPPKERAKYRSELLQSMESERGQWELAARELAAQHPTFIDLDRQLIGAICTRPAPKPPAFTPERPVVATSSSSSSSRWAIVLAVIIVIGLLRFMIATSKPSPSTPTFPSPPISTSEEFDKLMEEMRKNRDENIYKLPPMPTFEPPIDPEGLSPPPGAMPLEEGLPPPTSPGEQQSLSP